MIKESELRDLYKMFVIFHSIEDASDYPRSMKEDAIVRIVARDGLIEQEPPAKEKWEDWMYAWTLANNESRSQCTGECKRVRHTIELAKAAIREAEEKSCKHS